MWHSHLEHMERIGGYTEALGHGSLGPAKKHKVTHQAPFSGKLITSLPLKAPVITIGNEQGHHIRVALDSSEALSDAECFFTKKMLKSKLRRPLCMSHGWETRNKFLPVVVRGRTSPRCRKNRLGRMRPGKCFWCACLPLWQRAFLLFCWGRKGFHFLIA